VGAIQIPQGVAEVKLKEVRTKCGTSIHGIPFSHIKERSTEICDHTDET
jgi:hypothetical protein